MVQVWVLFWNGEQALQFKEWYDLINVFFLSMYPWTFFFNLSHLFPALTFIPWKVSLFLSQAMKIQRLILALALLHLLLDYLDLDHFSEKEVFLPSCNYYKKRSYVLTFCEYISKVTILLLPGIMKVVCKGKIIGSVRVPLSPMTWVGHKWSWLFLLCSQDKDSHNLGPVIKWYHLILFSLSAQPWNLQFSFCFMALTWTS